MIMQCCLSMSTGVPTWHKLVTHAQPLSVALSCRRPPAGDADAMGLPSSAPQPEEPGEDADPLSPEELELCLAKLHQQHTAQGLIGQPSTPEVRPL